MILVFSKKNGNNALKIGLNPYTVLVFMIHSTMCSGKKCKSDLNKHKSDFFYLKKNHDFFPTQV